MQNDDNRDACRSKLDELYNETTSDREEPCDTDDDEISRQIHKRFVRAPISHLSDTNNENTMSTATSHLFEKPKTYFAYNQTHKAKNRASTDCFYQDIVEDSDEEPAQQKNLGNFFQRVCQNQTYHQTYDDIKDDNNNDFNNLAMALTQSNLLYKDLFDNNQPNTDQVNKPRKKPVLSSPSLSATASSSSSSSASSSLPSLGNIFNPEPRPTEPSPSIIIETSQNKEPVNLSSTSTSTTSNQFVFKDRECANKILEGLNNLRLSKTMFDIILVVDGEEFHCHKCVLASLSDYFNAMFNTELAESKQTHVAINSLDAAIMKLIVDYAYTAQLSITDANVQALLTAANLFDIKPVKEACCRYMEWQMEDFNCKHIKKNSK